MVHFNLLSLNREESILMWFCGTAKNKKNLMWAHHETYALGFNTLIKVDNFIFHIHIH